MFTIASAQVVLGIYTVFLIVGGLVGYRKAGSRASLIAGLVSAGLCLAALLASVFGAPVRGLQAATVVVLLLALLFGYRYAVKTRKFMPAGMLAALSLAVFVFLTATIL